MHQLTSPFAAGTETSTTKRRAFPTSTGPKHSFTLCVNGKVINFVKIKTESSRGLVKASCWFTHRRKLGETDGHPLLRWCWNRLWLRGRCSYEEQARRLHPGGPWGSTVVKHCCSCSCCLSWFSWHHEHAKFLASTQVELDRKGSLGHSPRVLARAHITLHLLSIVTVK